MANYLIVTWDGAGNLVPRAGSVDVRQKTMGRIIRGIQA